MIIKAYSKAKYSTWIYYSPLSLLFDAGEGINCFMEERLVTISNIFLSHGHTDHYTGLINILMTKLAHFNNSEVLFPTTIFYPKDDITLSNYINYIIESYNIDKSPIPIIFTPVKSGEIYELNQLKNRFVEVFAMEHTKDVSAVGYKISEHRTKLKSEYLGLNQREIQKLIIEKGKKNITYTMNKPLLVYSGDGITAPYEKIENCEILFHECTFLNSQDRRGQLHSTFDEVIELAIKLNLKKLFLYHFSSRYTKDQIKYKINEAKPLLPNTEIYFIPPNKTFVLE